MVAHMDVDRQIECAKGLDQNAVAIIISVNGNYERTCPKALSLIRKSGAKSVLITSNPTIDLVRKVDHVIRIGDKAHMKMGKHTLLTVIELMACRYFALYSHENRVLNTHLGVFLLNEGGKTWRPLMNFMHENPVVPLRRNR